MKKVTLGSSNLQVSEVCLGTMTWGGQNTQDEANSQIEYALAEGINFVDTAEMYAIPPTPETYGKTESYIGNWLAANKAKRGDIVLASKVAGPGIQWIRGGSNVTGENLTQALDESLQRLQTDYIDLYQIHWANRVSPHFGKHWPQKVDHQAVDVNQQRDGMLDILRAMSDAVSAGKIRYCGLSDETPWGIQEYVTLAKDNNLPHMVSIQNEFSLLHLKDSPYVMETCALENVAYLPWSPMAGGALSGKYRNGARPEKSRWTMTQRNGIFRDTPQTHKAIDALYEIAQTQRISLAQLSLAWVYQFNGVTSTIIGATSMAQLKENIDAYQLKLSEEVLADIDAVIHQYPMPF